MAIPILRTYSPVPLKNNTPGTPLSATCADEIPLAGLVVGHILEGIVSAPENYPDIFVVWNLTVSCGCFWVYWGSLSWKLWGGKVVRYWKGKRKIQ